jgi:hypothetical protein
VRKLPATFGVTRYKGDEAQTLQNILLLPVIINKHRFSELPFLILNLGHRDIIIGRKWFEHYNVLIHPRKRRLIWPEEQQEYIAQHELTIPRALIETPPINTRHQRDADRRDDLLDKQPPFKP